jgi:hypothetical protein
MERVVDGTVPYGAGNANNSILIDPRATAPAGIVLVNRDKAKLAVSYAGAVRTEVRVTRDAAKKELQLDFFASAEPRLLNHAILGQPILENKGRKLPLAEDAKSKDPQELLRERTARDSGALVYGVPRNGRVAQLRIRDDQAHQLAELAGNLTLQVDLQNVPLARIGKVLDAAGKSVDGNNGGAMKVQAVKKLDNGNLQIQVGLDNLTPNPFGGNVVINGNGVVMIRGNVFIKGGGMVIGPNGVRVNGASGNHKDLPDLLDARGQKFKVAAVTADSFNFVNGSTSRVATIEFAPNPGQADPSELVLFGTRTHTIAVPFRFEKLPLP